MSEPIWLECEVVRLLQSESLADHGGSSGTSDASLLELTISGPIKKWNHNPAVDLAELAAAYGFGLAQNHPFVDGNKRIAFIATALFLRLNGYRLSSDPLDEIQTMLRLAAGELGEEEFAVWIRNHTKSTK
jgi:death on curing protein